MKNYEVVKGYRFMKTYKVVRCYDFVKLYKVKKIKFKNQNNNSKFIPILQQNISVIIATVLY